MVTEAFVVRELWQPFPARAHKLGLCHNAVPVPVQGREHFCHDFVCLLLVRCVPAGFLAARLVVHAIDCFELGAVEDVVAVQVVQLEEGLCGSQRASEGGAPSVARERRGADRGWLT